MRILSRTRSLTLPEPIPVKKSAAGRNIDLRHIVQLLGRFLRGQRRLFILALAMLIAEAATAVFEAYPLAYLIDYLKGDRPDLLALFRLPVLVSPAVDTIAMLTAAIIVMAMVNSLADSMAEIYLAKAGRMLGFNLRVALYSHLQRLSLAFHDQRRTGDILTRVTGDVTALEDFVIGSLSDIVGSLLVLAGTLAFLLYHSWQVSLVAVLIVPVLAAVSHYFSQRIKAASKKQRAREGDLASAAQEMLTSIRVIQTYSSADYEQKRFAEYSHKSMNAGLEAAGLQARFSWTVKVLESLAISAIVWMGLWLVDRSAITVGTLLLFIVLIQNMFKPTRKIIKEWNTIGKIYASVERIGELLDRKPSVTDRPDAIQAPTLQGHIEFRNVSFAYQPDAEEAERMKEEAPLALRNISFGITSGEVLALVGQTGAGKSTVAQLLPRLYDPHVGQVLIDGHDIRTFTLDSLRSQISVVLQETILFSGSVADNIGYGRTEATREEIIAAALQANAHEFIEKLPEGYDALLGERGANLSGGQRQRIAIARAFIRNTPILILDEPTTGLDAGSTELVLLALRTLMKGKTTIIISHDFNLIRHADRIVVLKEGGIEQVGTHKSLLEAGGLYAHLYFKQFGQADVIEGEESAESVISGRASGEGWPAPASLRSPFGPGGLGAGSLQSSAFSPRPSAPPSLPPTRLQAARLDPLHSPVLRRELPGLETAFDGEAMRECLQIALFGDDGDQYTVERCTPGKATYLFGKSCSLRYELEVRDNVSGQMLTPLVLARVFRSQSACKTYLRERLKPLAALMRGRQEIAPFAAPVAMLKPLNMTVSLFPIDGELPTLVGATDRQRMIEVLRETLPAALDDGFTVDDCRVELGHYGRQHRCVLRYHVDGRPASANMVQHQMVYGKVAADDRGAVAGPVISALRKQIVKGGHGHRFNIPSFLGFRPDLKLALFEAIPGTPQIAPLLTARLNGVAQSEPGSLTLEEALAMGAHIATALHTSDITLGDRRTLDNELITLRQGISAIQRLSPELGMQLRSWLERLETYAEQSEPLPLCLCHGDFTHTQLVFDDTASGLVDFDTVCQAEPALDLGQFLAYLRVATYKADQGAPSVPIASAEELCAQFLNAYILASGDYRTDAERLHLRVQLYEGVSLLRMALHSWQKFKGSRLEHVISAASATGPSF